MSTGWIARLQVSEPLCSSLLLILQIFLFSLNWYFLFMSLKFSGIIFPAISNLLLKSSSELLGVSGDSVGKGSTYNVGDWVQSLGGEDSLKEGMATHSSILPWRIPCIV